MPTATIVSTGFHQHGRVKAENTGAPDLPLIVLPHPLGHLAPADVAAMAQTALPSVLASLTSAKNSLRLDYIVDYVLPKGAGGDGEECEDCKV